MENLVLDTANAQPVSLLLDDGIWETGDDHAEAPEPDVVEVFLEDIHPAHTKLSRNQRDSIAARNRREEVRSILDARNRKLQREFDQHPENPHAKRKFVHARKKTGRAAIRAARKQAAEA